MGRIPSQITRMNENSEIDCHVDFERFVVNFLQGVTCH